MEQVHCDEFKKPYILIGKGIDSNYPFFFEKWRKTHKEYFLFTFLSTIQEYSSETRHWPRLERQAVDLR